MSDMLVCAKGPLSSVPFPSSLSLETATSDCKKLAMCEDKGTESPEATSKVAAVETRLNTGYRRVCLLLAQIYMPILCPLVCQNVTLFGDRIFIEITMSNVNIRVNPKPV